MALSEALAILPNYVTRRSEAAWENEHVASLGEIITSEAHASGFVFVICSTGFFFWLVWFLGIEKKHLRLKLTKKD